MDHPVVENLYELVVWPKGTQPHILDIGANVGQFATEMRSIFGNAHIHSIEANPYCEAKLGKKQSNGHLNEYQIVALGKEEGELDFYYSERKPAGKGASFYPEIQGKEWYWDTITTSKKHMEVVNSIDWESDDFDIVMMPAVDDVAAARAFRDLGINRLIPMVMLDSDASLAARLEHLSELSTSI